MTSKEVRNFIMEFWNEEILGQEVVSIKSRDTVMRAVLDLDLVGKVQCIQKEKKLFLINLDLIEKESKPENN